MRIMWKSINMARTSTHVQSTYTKIMRNHVSGSHTYQAGGHQARGMKIKIGQQIIRSHGSGILETELYHSNKIQYTHIQIMVFIHLV